MTTSYTGNPYAEADSAYYAREREEVQRDRMIEFQVESFMTDCMELEDAKTIVYDHDLLDSDLLENLMVMAARANTGSMSDAQAISHMNALLRTEFRKIAERELDS